jgi:hypothetical protein
MKRDLLRPWFILFCDITQRWVAVLYRRFGTMYRSHLQESRNPRTKPSFFLDFLVPEDGTDSLSRNVGTGLPLSAALYPRKAQISSASQRKPEITYTQPWKQKQRTPVKRLTTSRRGGLSQKTGISFLQSNLLESFREREHSVNYSCVKTNLFKSSFTLLVSRTESRRQW